MCYSKIKIIILIFFLTTNPVFSENRNEILDNNIKNIIENNKMISLNIAIIKENSILFQRSYNSLNKDDNSNNTLYRVASISKLFTSLLFMKIVENKKVRLDDIVTINDLELKNPYNPSEKITYKKLLSHRSGLKEENSLSYKHFLKKTGLQKKIPHIKELFDKKSLLYSKDIWNYDKSTFHYSNLGFIIIANKIEEILKKPFDICIKEMLENTNIRASFSPYRKDNRKIATLYSWNKYSQKHIKTISTFINKDLKDYSPGYNAAIFSPQGGLRASLNDLTNLINIMLLKGKGIISEKTWKTMHDIHYKSKEKKDFYEKYGLGIHITDQIFNDITMYGHSGGSFGLTSNLYYNPQKKIGIAIICNGADLKNSATSSFYRHEEELFKAIERYLNKIQH